MTDERTPMPKVGGLWKWDDGTMSGEFTCQHCQHKQKFGVYPNDRSTSPKAPGWNLKGRGEPELDEYANKRAAEAKSVPDEVPF